MGNQSSAPLPEEKSKPSGGGSKIMRRLAALALLVLFWYISNYTIKTTYTDIYSPKVSQDIKIVLIADLHGAEFGKENARLLRKIESENPDAVFIAGDMHTNYDTDGMKVSIDFMNKLECPSFFVYGEHDRNMYDYKDFHNNNLYILNPDTSHYSSSSPAIQGMEIMVGDTYIDIVGVNYAPANYDISNYLKRNEERFTIVLSHIFNHGAAEKFRADLTLCGDTHGGIIRFPFLGAAYYEGEFFPSLRSDKAIYDKGLFEYDGGYAYVSGGLGAYPYPIRLFNRPEINVITIKPQN